MAVIDAADIACDEYRRTWPLAECFASLRVASNGTNGEPSMKRIGIVTHSETEKESERGEHSIRPHLELTWNRNLQQCSLPVARNRRALPQSTQSKCSWYPC